MGTIQGSSGRPEPIYHRQKLINIHQRVEECLSLHEMFCGVYSHHSCDCDRMIIRQRILQLVADVRAEEASRPKFYSGNK